MTNTLKPNNAGEENRFRRTLGTLSAVLAVAGASYLYSKTASATEAKPIAVYELESGSSYNNDLPEISLGEQRTAEEYKGYSGSSPQTNLADEVPESSVVPAKKKSESRSTGQAENLSKMSRDQRLEYLGLELSEINSVNDEVLRKIPDEIFELPLMNMYPEAVMANQDLINDLAESSGISPNLIAILMTIESKGNPNAKSGAGAYGLFQVTHVAMQDLVQLPPGHIAHDANALEDFNKLKEYIDNGKHLSDEQLRRHGELAFKYWLRCLEFAKNRLENRGVSNYNRALLSDLAAASYNGGSGNLENNFDSWPKEMQNYLRLVYKGLVLAVLNYDPDSNTINGIIFTGDFEPILIN